MVKKEKRKESVINKRRLEEEVENPEMRKTGVKRITKSRGATANCKEGQMEEGKGSENGTQNGNGFEGQQCLVLFG